MTGQVYIKGYVSRKSVVLNIVDGLIQMFLMGVTGFLLLGVIYLLKP